MGNHVQGVFGYEQIFGLVFWTNVLGRPELKPTQVQYGALHFWLTTVDDLKTW